MSKQSILFFCCSWLPICLAAQPNFANKDTVYLDNIHAVKCHLTGFPLAMPIVDIDKNSTISLDFDNTEAENKRYLYNLTLCNANWQATDLQDFEYLTGFNENRINEFQLSYNTLSKYTHYHLSLPNSDIRWTRSGNYLLKIYEDDNEKAPVLTRRLMVVEPKMQIEPQMTAPMGGGKSQSHQEIDFSVSHKGIAVRNPKIEINAVVLQNQRWDNAIGNLKPFFIREESVDFDYQDVISFPAGKEFRFFDMRSFRYNSAFIESTLRYRNGYGVTLSAGRRRDKETRTFFRDANGCFLVENSEDPSLLNNLRPRTSLLDNLLSNLSATNRSNPNQTLSNFAAISNTSDVTADYAIVNFTLDSPTDVENTEMYVVGQLSDWQPRANCRMTYNPERHAYEAAILLKQGYYNYAFAAVHQNNPDALDTSETEGDYYETDNEYTILVYYRPFGERSDRLVAARSFSSLMARR